MGLETGFRRMPHSPRVFEDLANHLGLLDERNHAHNTLTLLPAFDRYTTSAASSPAPFRFGRKDFLMKSKRSCSSPEMQGVASMSGLRDIPCAATRSPHSRNLNMYGTRDNRRDCQHSHPLPEQRSRKRFPNRSIHLAPCSNKSPALHNILPRGHYHYSMLAETLPILPLLRSANSCKDLCQVIQALA